MQQYSFSAIFDDQESRAEFKSYLERSKNLEPLLFIEQVEQFFLLKSDMNRYNKATEILKLFLLPNISKHELNVSSVTRQAIIDTFENQCSTNHCPRNLFEPIHNLVFLELQHDCFPRFVKSGEFDKFLQRMKRKDKSYVDKIIKNPIDSKKQATKKNTRSATMPLKLSTPHVDPSIAITTVPPSNESVTPRDGDSKIHSSSSVTDDSLPLDAELEDLEAADEKEDQNQSEMDEELEKLAQIFAAFSKPYTGVQVKDRKSGLFKTYANTFTGSDAVTWICSYLRVERSVAVQIATDFLNNHFITPANHRSKNQKTITDSNDFYYRFVQKKKVVIVGGGFGGSVCARKLQKDFDVTLIDPKPSFEYILDFPQLIVDPSLINKICTPYNKILKTGKIITESVKFITENAVYLDSYKGVDDSCFTSIPFNTSSTSTSTLTSSSSSSSTTALQTNDDESASVSVSASAAASVSVSASVSAAAGGGGGGTEQDESSVLPEITVHQNKNTSPTSTTIGDKSPRSVQEPGKIPFDYLIVGTGSQYMLPFPIDEKSQQKIIYPYSSTSILSHFAHLRSAKQIAVIGGGALGLEIIGEIADSQPTTQIMLISQRNVLLERTCTSAHKNATKILSKYNNVKLMLSRCVTAIKDGIIYFKLVVKTDDKNSSDSSFIQEEQINADLIVLCGGIVPRTGIFHPHMSHALNSYGQVIVNNKFQVLKKANQIDSNDKSNISSIASSFQKKYTSSQEASYYENIFAIGDITSVKEEKLAQVSMLHANVVAGNLKSIDQGKSNQKLNSYEPQNRIQIISVGPNRAIMIHGEKVITEGAFMAKMKKLVKMRVMLNVKT